MKIDTVIFDIGGVLSVLGRMTFFRRFDYSEEICLEIMQATVLSPWWKELDRSVMSVPEVIDHFVAENPAREKEIRHIMEDIRGIVVPSEDAVRWIRKVKETGRKVLYLSNWSQKVTDDCPGALYFMPEMDGGVFSYECHLIKPEEPIYREILARYDLVPERCVFIDDTEINLEVPRRLGMHTIRYVTQEQAESELDALLAE